MFDRTERAVSALARAMAWAGGAALIALVAMSCVSILGRAGQHLGLPVTSLRGDTEWVEFATGFAVFAFLPWCTLMRGHATVDMLRPLLGQRLNQMVDLLADLAILALAVLIAWRMWQGMLDKKGFGETTFILQAEVWKGYAAAMLGAGVFVLVAVFCALRSGRALTGRRG